MRFSRRRSLKSFIYLSVALFILFIIQKQNDYNHEGNITKSEAADKEIIGLVKQIRKKEEESSNGKNLTAYVKHNSKNSEDDEDDYYEYEDEEEEEGEDEKKWRLEEEKEVGPEPLLDSGEALRPEKNFGLVAIEGEGVKRDPEPPNEENKDLQDFFAEREQVYSDRRKNIQQVCKQLGEKGSYGSMEDVPLRRLRWLNKKRLIMCFNAKVGTSTWTQYLMEAGYPGLLKNVSHWHHTAERFLKPPYKRRSWDSIKLMKGYSKVILVRDPFARIVSAYLDKVARMKFASLCRMIVQKYRDKSSSELQQRQPTFEEFVHFLVDSTPTDDDIKVKRNFRNDRHWFHYYANCAPCNIDYDIVATMETVHEDTRYIIEKFKLGLADNIWNNHQAKSSSEEMAIKMFQDIPRNLTLELYQRYQIDFMMFNYKVDKYLTPQ